MFFLTRQNAANMILMALTQRAMHTALRAMALTDTEITVMVSREHGKANGDRAAGTQRHKTITTMRSTSGSTTHGKISREKIQIQRIHFIRVKANRRQKQKACFTFCGALRLF